MWFELTTFVVIGTDCTCSCKSNYYTIMTTVHNHIRDELFMGMTNVLPNHSRMMSLEYRSVISRGILTITTIGHSYKQTNGVILKLVTNNNIYINIHIKFKCRFHCFDAVLSSQYTSKFSLHN